MKTQETMQNKSESGQVMMLTVLLLSLAFSLSSFLAGSIIVYQVRAASTITSAMVAVFAGDSGLQCGLYQQVKNPLFVTSMCPTMTNGASYVLTPTITPETATASSTTVLHSQGIFRETSRTLEASF